MSPPASGSRPAAGSVVHNAVSTARQIAAWKLAAQRAPPPGIPTPAPDICVNLLIRRDGNPFLDNCLKKTFNGKGPSICCYPGCVAPNGKNRCIVCQTPTGHDAGILSPVYEADFCADHINHDLHLEGINQSHVVDVFKRMPALKTAFHEATGNQAAMNEFCQVLYILGVSPMSFFAMDQAMVKQLRDASMDYYLLKPAQKKQLIAARAGRTV